MKTDTQLRLEHDNQRMREFIQELSRLTHFSHKDECREFLVEVDSPSVLKDLKTLDELQRKLDSKYEDSITAVLNYVYNNCEPDEYNKVHETLFKFKSQIMNNNE